MRAVERLKRDHKVLRSKLDVLGAVLRMTPPTMWFILRELCYTLSRQLQDHIRREEQLIATCRATLKPEALAQVDLEHHDEPELLRTVNHLFIEEGGKAVEQIRGVLGELIPRLRRHMDEEEAELFPVIEQALGDQEASEGQEPLLPVRLCEEMTVNCVLHTYPQTKRLLERLFINVPYEGYDCLDEVAWRRGMDCCQLVLLLEEAIAAEWNRESATVVSPQTAAA